MSETNLTFRLYKDGEAPTNLEWSEEVLKNGESYLCPTYFHRTPPCQGSCPSGHDIRGWLSIAIAMKLKNMWESTPLNNMWVIGL